MYKYATVLHGDSGDLWAVCNLQTGALDDDNGLRVFGSQAGAIECAWLRDGDGSTPAPAEYVMFAASAGLEQQLADERRKVEKQERELDAAWGVKRDLTQALEMSTAYLGRAVADGLMTECVVAPSRALTYCESVLDRHGRTPR